MHLGEEDWLAAREQRGDRCGGQLLQELQLTHVEGAPVVEEQPIGVLRVRVEAVVKGANAPGLTMH